MLVIDEIGKVLHFPHHLRAVEWILRDAIFIGRVLELTLPGGVAGRTVECMVDEEEFQQVLTRLVRGLVMCGDLHPVPYRSGARNDKATAPPENIDDAHLAGAPRPQVR